MPGVNDINGVPYMTAEEMAAIEAECSLSAVLPWGGKYPGDVGVVRRDGFHIVGPDGNRYADAHQRILSYSLGGHAEEVNAAIDATRARFPGATLVDTTEYFEPATLLMWDLHKALMQYGDYLIQLAATGTGANEQAIRLAMGSLGGPYNIRLLALANNYPGAGLVTNSICDAPGWRGDTSLPPNAEVLALDGSNMDEIFTACELDSKKPILIMEDGVQGVGGFNLLDVKFLRELVERVRGAGGRTISDNVQTFVRATDGKGLFGFNRWADPEDPRHLPDFVTFAKGLGDGHPMAGLAVKRSVAKPCKTSPKGPGNTFDTFNRYRDSLAVARKVLEISQRDNLPRTVYASGEQFQANLRPMLERFSDLVDAVVGIGGMTGLRFRNADKLTMAMNQAPASGMVAAKGGLAMRLPLQFDTTREFVEELSGCVEHMLKTVQAKLDKQRRGA